MDLSRNEYLDTCKFLIQLPSLYTSERALEPIKDCMVITFVSIAGFQACLYCSTYIPRVRDVKLVIGFVIVYLLLL